MRNGDLGTGSGGGGGRGDAADSPAGSTTVRLPSRSTSPTGLRCQPQVGITAVEAHSDILERLREDAAMISEQVQGLGEDPGREKEVQLSAPKPVWTSTFADEPIIQAGIADYTFVPLNEGGLLGRGKFSSVQLAWKAGRKFAVKVTPLYPHHNLIATRLLREPTILAQLPLHPNLVKVFESIRTPGHFYLVEEFLDGYTNLESFVASQPKSRLTLSQATHIFEQLVSVVRSALHQPIQIAHRDIKPENILIHPDTLHITLLDFGLATHFSEREPKLTTCCGSPAFHAPELFLSLKSPPGSVRYWGPEVDIWTIGITLLRCLTGVKYPLGVTHTSVQHMEDKTLDALLSVEDKAFRRTLAGLLDMNGERRIKAFRALPAELDQAPYLNGAAIAKVASREFKNTSFLPTEPKYTLPLPLLSPTWLSPPRTPAAGNAIEGSPLKSRSVSRDRLAAQLAAGLELSDIQTASASTGKALRELILLNPTGEAPMRAISFVKYALRCAGIIYHIQPESPDMAKDLPSVGAPIMSPDYPTFHCVCVLPKEAAPVSPAANLLTQLRPGLARSQTAMPARSSSNPGRARTGTQQGKKPEAPQLRLLEFWVQAIPVFSTTSPPSLPPSRASSRTRDGSSTKRAGRRRGTKSRSKSTDLSSMEEDRTCTKIRIRISDPQAAEAMRHALSIGRLHTDSAGPYQGRDARRTETERGSKAQEHSVDETSRGRPKMSRSISNDQNGPARVRPPMSRAVTERPGEVHSATTEEHPEQTLAAQVESLLQVPKAKKGFFDFVSFGGWKTSSNPGSVAVTPVSEEPPRLDKPAATPAPLAFAAM